jgi:hypothetical protein
MGEKFERVTWSDLPPRRGQRIGERYEVVIQALASTLDTPEGIHIPAPEGRDVKKYVESLRNVVQTRFPGKRLCYRIVNGKAYGRLETRPAKGE